MSIKKSIRLSSYSSKAFYTFCKEVKTKKEVMRMLVLKYPELSFHYRKEVSNKNKYYVKLFEAAGVATLRACANSIKKFRQRELGGAE